MSEVLVPFVNCLMVLDSSGERIMAKYYDQRPKSEQDKYEALLHKKTKTLSFRSDAEVLLLDQEVFVVRGSSDCKIVVSGCIDEVGPGFLFTTSYSSPTVNDWYYVVL